MYIANLKKFICYFGKGRKLKLGIFLLMSIFAGLLEFAGVALIYPFVIVIISPDKLSNFAANYHINFLSLDGAYNFALILGVAALLLFVLKNLYMILFLFVQSKFVAKWTQHINNMFMKYFIYAPYKNILKISNASKLYTITTLSGQATGSFLFRILSLVTNVSIVLLIIGLLLWKFPLAGLFSFGFIVISLVFQNLFFKNKVKKLGNELQKTAKDMNLINYTTINNIKDVKIFGKEKIFYEDFGTCGAQFSGKNALLTFFTGVPPYMVELLIVVTMLLTGAIIAVKAADGSVMIASFAMVVASVFRIAPALNRIQSALLNLPAGLNFVKELNTTYERFELKNFDVNIAENSKVLPFNNKIILHNLSFSYEPEKEILHNISFEINKGEFVGIIGLSGAGKSTLADILTGLLTPDAGEIIVDSTKINEENNFSFRKNIGYVQQDLNVLEKSFRENVAWGIPVDKIDDNRVKYLIEQVQLQSVVEKYENGIYAVPFVGDNGLSRGQIQRLAIARALYPNPEILIFDEATSALDVKIEHEITNMLLNIGKDKTIIAIAHRLSTLKACNKLIYLKDGTLIDVGSFEELSEKYPEFAELVSLSSLQ